MDRDEIIRRLKKIADHSVHTVGELPLALSLDDGIALYEAADLLKEQEAVEPITDNEGGYWCGSCHEDIVWHQKYCSNCGQAVKWK